MVHIPFDPYAANDEVRRVMVDVTCGVCFDRWVVAEEDLGVVWVCPSCGAEHHPCQHQHEHERPPVVAGGEFAHP